MQKVHEAGHERHARLIYAGRITKGETVAYPYGKQFYSPYDNDSMQDAMVESAKRAGDLLAEVALQKMGSIIEALAWVQWSWRSEPLAEIDQHTHDAARTALLNRATEAERLMWLRIDASGSCASLDDVRWWLEVEAPRMIERMREAA